MAKHFDSIYKSATLVIKNPRTQQLKSEILDLAVKDGRIAEIGSSFSWDAPIVHDLKHLHVLPGMIDSQVHFRDPGLTHKEDIESGSLQALMGGVTAYFEMPNTKPPTTTVEALQTKMQTAREKSYVHWAFYGGASHDNLSALHDMERTPHCPGIKLFMGSSTGNLLVAEKDLLAEVLRQTRKRLVVHCEYEARLIERREIAEKAGHPRAHCIWRDEESAFLATELLVNMAREMGRQVHVLHVSSKKEMEFLKTQKKTATVEVLANHLHLHAPDCYERLGTLAQQNPPVREKFHQDALWRGIVDGTVDILATDHAPHTLAEKLEARYPATPSGMPGVQTFVPIFLDSIKKGRITLELFCQLASENPARIFGVQGKGRLEPGFDADLTIVDLQKEWTIQNKWIRSKSQWSPFDGQKICGRVEKTVLLGQLAMSDDTVIGRPHGLGLNFSTGPASL